MPLDFPEPPTEAAVALAREQLALLANDSRTLERRIQDAKDALARIVEERQSAIRDMERELATVEDRLALTRAYVSPIKRLPHELLRHIFLFNFDHCAWSAWILSSVCSLWRRLVLSMPKLWSKVRPLRPILPRAARPAPTVHAPLSPPLFSRTHLRLGDFHSTSDP